MSVFGNALTFGGGSSGDMVNVLAGAVWEQGAISGNAGQSYANCKTASSTRIRTSALLSTQIGYPVFLDFDAANFDVVIMTFDSSGNCVTTTSYGNAWLQSPLWFVPTQPYSAFAVRRRDQSSITPDANTGIAVTQVLSV